MEYFIIWLSGAIVPLIKPLNIRKAFTKYVILFTSLCLAVFSLFYNAGSSYFLDLRVGIMFALLTYLLVSIFNLNKVKNNLPKYFASFSYTLYLTHYPLANLILTWRVSPLWPFGGNSLLIKATLTILVFGYAWVFGLLIEKQTEKVRRRLSKIIFRNEIMCPPNKKVL
jgi:peptidoglycan/LPS O-acetylase OafA/YrhL